MLPETGLALRFLFTRGQVPRKLSSVLTLLLRRAGCGGAPWPLLGLDLLACLAAWKEGVDGKQLLAHRALLGFQQTARLLQATLQRESVLWEKKQKKRWETGPLASEESHHWVTWVCPSFSWPQRLLGPPFHTSPITKCFLTFPGCERIGRLHSPVA